MTGFLFLVLLWEKALYLRERIEADLKERFDVLRAFEIRWSRRLFAQNLTRFYGTNLPPGSHKEKHCGMGPFALYIVQDTKPQFDFRDTSKGRVKVHLGSFEAKWRYREWSGGGHRIHTSLTEEETRQDLALLVGRRPEEFSAAPPWSGQVEVLEENLAGAEGWRDLGRLFLVLNGSVNYVILRNFENLPNGPLLPGTDIDLLTDNYGRLCSLVNGRRVFQSKRRVHFRVPVNGNEIAFDFRHVGDGYYDSRWEEAILKTRRLNEKGLYVPQEPDFFYSLLYHACVHKRFLREDYRQKLPLMAKNLGLAVSDGFLETPSLRRLLDAYLHREGYAYTEPRDLSVFFNSEFTGMAASWPRRLNESRFLLKEALREGRAQALRLAAAGGNA